MPSLARETHAPAITRERLAAVGQRAEDAAVVLPCGGVLIGGPCMTTFSMRRHAPGRPVQRQHAPGDGVLPCGSGVLFDNRLARRAPRRHLQRRRQLPCCTCGGGRTGEGVRGAGNGAAGALQSGCGGLHSGCKALAQRVRSSSAEWIRPNFWEQLDADEPCFEDSAMLHKTIH